MGCNYTDSEGEIKPIVMGSYGIGSGRLLACIAEEHHDEFGLSLPITVAPYQIYLIVLSAKSIRSDIPAINQDTQEIAENIYELLLYEGFEVLYDDRELSPGVKFADADLIGIPIRLTISNRSLRQGGAELKIRSFEAKTIIPLDGVVDQIKKIVNSLTTEAHKRIKVVDIGS
jgi:prolyl-tRNA synthetase